MEATASEALLEGLNEPQREAVLHGEGPLLILAGAGSGKTRVLTRRIAHLVGSGQARPGEILAITFTNKAAQEMRERVEQLVGNRARAMWVMTFHSACARILRAEAEKLGYTRGFTIYDEQDSLRLVKACIDELDIDPKRFAPRGIRRQISDAKNALLDAEAYRLKVSTFFEQTAADVYDLYEKRLHAANAMDFDDLLFRAVNLFELYEEVRDRYRRSFRHVLVDEYQDTNRAQYRWLQLLTEEQPEPVRRWRRRSVGVRLPRSRHPEHPWLRARLPRCPVVKLEQNYRSTQTILNASNGVIANNRQRKDKFLWSELGEGDPVHVRELEDEHAEARFVVSEIERLVDQGESRDEIAVFYRTNAQSRVLEDMLVRYGVGYQVIGGTRFYERAEIKDALAYLTLLVNPADTVAFGRAVNSPRRGIGNTTQGRLVGYANTIGEPIWDVAAEPESVPGLAAAAVKAVGRFMSVMERLRERVEAGAGVGDILAETLEESGYTEDLHAQRTIESQGRLENLEELVGVAREYDATAEERLGRGVPAAARALLGAGQPARRAGDRHADDSPQREGPRVRDRLHHRPRGRRLPAHALDRVGRPRGGASARLRWDHPREAELYLTHARTRMLFGGRDWNLRSRFIDEIPVEFTDRDEEAPTGPAAAATWGGGASAPEPRGGDGGGSRASFSLGDDVVHAQFGDGVVVGIEPGGLVVVRFAGDRSERKLMADYAPLKRR